MFSMRLSIATISRYLIFFSVLLVLPLFILFKSSRIPDEIYLLSVVSIVFLGFGAFIIARFLEYTNRKVARAFSLAFSFFFTVLGVIFVWFSGYWKDYLIFLVFVVYMLWRFSR